MAKPTFIDCNGLAGFMSYGFVQAGMEMTLRTGTLDFGNKVAEANKRHLGKKWDSFFSSDENEWPVQDADVVMGCPPCSGWSVWSGPANRGPDSPAHEHTRAFMRYAAKVKPEIIIFECVQQAYTQGRDVMVKYRDMVEELSGERYDLYHVKHNNLMLGGYSYRPRYFWVATKGGMPFAANAPVIKQLPRISEVIGDLAKMPLQWEAQPYSAPADKWVARLRSQTGMVTGHIGKQNIHAQRIKEVFDIVGNDGWENGDNLGETLRKAYHMNGNTLPPSWENIGEGVLRSDFNLGFSQPYRWGKKLWCNVLTGSALDHVVHPTEPRLITHREAARIQGLPDDWEIESVKDYTPLQATWGKAVAAQAANWIGKATVSALNGKVNTPGGELIGDREYLIDTDTGFSRQKVKKQWYPETDSE